MSKCGTYTYPVETKVRNAQIYRFHTEDVCRISDQNENIGRTIKDRKSTTQIR